jgi:Scd6-like Sm domain
LISFYANTCLFVVTVHGTEGRKKNIKEVSPSDTMYDYVVFKSADIINLSVHETPSTLLVDPAIVSVVHSIVALISYLDIVSLGTS